MGLFDTQINFINGLEAALFRVMEETVQQFDFVMKDYIINKQLFTQGIDGNSVKLPGYKRTTIRYKIAKGDPTDRTTLRDEGSFYRSIEITATSQYFVVSSDVPYDDKLTKKYGKDILKITNENMREFMDVYFLPNLKKYVNNQAAG
jgi:hypothetical protein